MFHQKRFFSALALVLLASLLLSPIAGATEAESTITVYGTGVVSIKPDKATISFGISSEEKDAKEAQSVNNEAANALLEALKALGLEGDAIVTENYTLYPNYDYSKSKPKVTGYTASHQFNVTVLDISIVGDVLDAAVEAGANQSYGFSFGVQDESEQYQEALRLAVASAQPKAEAIAAASGKTLGSIVSIIENGSTPSYRAYYSEYAVAQAYDGGMPVQTGSLDIQATVTLVYTVQ